jgi:hypothetical protein
MAIMNSLLQKLTWYIYNWNEVGYRGCQSGAVVRSMFEINISAGHLGVVGSNPGQTHSSCDREGDRLSLTA